MNTAIPAELGRIIDKALEKDRELLYKQRRRIADRSETIETRQQFGQGAEKNCRSERVEWRSCGITHSVSNGPTGYRRGAQEMAYGILSVITPLEFLQHYFS